MIVAAPFFVAGGTVPPGAPSYVTRDADDEIFEALIAREFCYVLNSRQMGKSSLAVHAMARLVEAGVRCAFVDLTKIGSAEVTEEQWYVGILAEVARMLGYRREMVAHLKQYGAVSPNQRFLTFLQEVVARSGPPVVIFVDEIDAVRSLSFSTDAFFAGIRQCWNARSTEPHLACLTFCLMGTALPSDLIRNARMTPFNIGRRIELRNFSPAEAKFFEAGITHVDSGATAAIVRRVLHWTGGQPFLTQRLCREVVAAGVADPRGVDDIVRGEYLTERARETDSHLVDIGNRLLGRGDREMTDEARADVLALYAKLLKGGVDDDETNPSAARIKMSGVATAAGRRLTVRNPIYREVFGPTWVRDNTPSQELRRQRRAFLRGALRTGLAASVAVGIVGGLAWNNSVLAAQAREMARRESYEAYVASMQTLASKWNEGKPSILEGILAKTERHPAEGWEWRYWRHQVIRPAAQYDVGSDYHAEVRDNKGQTVLVTLVEEARQYEIRTGKLLKKFPLPKPGAGAWTGRWCPDGRRVVLQDFDRQLLVVDVAAGKVVAERKMPQPVTLLRRDGTGYLPGGRLVLWMVNPDQESGKFFRLSPDDLSIQELPLPNGISLPQVNRQGTQATWVEVDPKSGRIARSVRDTETWKELHRFPMERGSTPAMWSPKGDCLYYVIDATLLRLDIASGKETPLCKVGVAEPISSVSDDGRSILFTNHERLACVVHLEGEGATVSPLMETRNAFFAGHGEAVVSSYRNVRVYRQDQLRIPQTPRFNVQFYRGGGILEDGRAFVHTANEKRDGKEYVVDLTQENPVVQIAKFGRKTIVDDRLRFRRQGGLWGWKLFDRASGEEVGRGTDDADFYAIVTSPNGRYVVNNSGRHHVSIYDVKAKKRIRRLGGIDSPLATKFSPDGKVLAVGDEYGNVHLWRTSDWKPLARLANCLQSVRCLAFSPDSSKLAAGGSDDLVKIIDVRSRRVVMTLEGGAGAVSAIAWSPERERIVTGGSDRVVRIWDAATGRELGVLGNHGDTIIGLGFLPGGRTLASVSADGDVKRWKTSDRL